MFQLVNDISLMAFIYEAHGVFLLVEIYPVLIKKTVSSSVARLMSKKDKHIDDCVAKGCCKGQGTGMCSLPHGALETKISPFPNQNFDTENQ